MRGSNGGRLNSNAAHWGRSHHKVSYQLERSASALGASWQRTLVADGALCHYLRTHFGIEHFEHPGLGHY
jgi:hypothetical protein